MNSAHKIHQDLFEPGVLLSVQDKWYLNLRMLDKVIYLLREIRNKNHFLHLYWYSLKYMMCALHAVYKLLYKILKVYGNTSMCWKNKYHNLVHGPRKISENVTIFSSLLAFIDIQLGLIGSIVWLSCDIKLQDQMSQIFYRLMHFWTRLFGWRSLEWVHT